MRPIKIRELLLLWSNSQFISDEIIWLYFLISMAKRALTLETRSSGIYEHWDFRHQTLEYVKWKLSGNGLSSLFGKRNRKFLLEAILKAVQKKKNHAYYIPKCQEFLKSNLTKPCLQSPLSQRGSTVMSLLDGPTSSFSRSLNLSAEISKCLFWKTQFIFDLRTS